MIKYTVTWKETWSTDDTTLFDLEEAKNWARMKKAMGYEEVKLEKVEFTEIEF